MRVGGMDELAHQQGRRTTNRQYPQRPQGRCRAHSPPGSSYPHRPAAFTFPRFLFVLSYFNNSMLWGCVGSAFRRAGGPLRRGPQAAVASHPKCNTHSPFHRRANVLERARLHPPRYAPHLPPFFVPTFIIVTISVACTQTSCWVMQSRSRRFSSTSAPSSTATS